MAECVQLGPAEPANCAKARLHRNACLSACRCSGSAARDVVASFAFSRAARSRAPRRRTRWLKSMAATRTAQTRNARHTRVHERTSLTGVRKCRFVRRWKALVSLGRSGGSSTCVETISVRLITTRVRRKPACGRDRTLRRSTPCYRCYPCSIESPAGPHSESRTPRTRTPRLRESVGCTAPCVDLPRRRDHCAVSSALVLSLPLPSRGWRRSRS